MWPDSRLLAAIDAHVGSQLSIGAAALRVTRVLISKPDQGSTFAELAPSLLMNEADLPATQLIQPGSRVSYAGLFAGERDRASTPSRPGSSAHKRAGERVRDITDASPQIRNAVDRAGRFLSLASLVSVLLCAIAVAMAARRYVHRHLDTVALLKTLGATRAFTLGVTVLQLLALALLAALVGAALGFLAQEWLLRTIRGLLAAHRAARAAACSRRHRLPHRDRGAGRLCAATAAAALARTGAARPAAGRRSAATPGDPGLRTGGRWWCCS